MAPPYKAPVLAACQVAAPPRSPAGAVGAGSGIGPHLPTMRQPLTGKASSLISFFLFFLKAMVEDFDLS